MTLHKIGGRTRSDWRQWYAKEPHDAEDFEDLLDAAFSADDPQWDCTDAAHPAWWRGQDYGANAIVREVGKILDGTHDAAGISSEPWESIRRKLIALVSAEERVQQLDAALRSIEKMPCIEELLGDEYPDGCGCARCIARAALTTPGEEGR